ncbi:hypothetical protein [Marinobacter sp.]|uniref:hypothetical protein n=1 Tax=Marinobacter sp. TaxID=50741 RepID=UPI0034A239B4
MNGMEQKPTPLVGLAAVIFGALLTMSGPGMAHQPPGAENAPEGIARATLVHEGGVRAMSAMVMDAPQPALMVRYHGKEPVIVYDSDNQPFLRFTDNRVDASPKSRYWQYLPQSKSYRDKGEERWVQVSGSGNFGWVDPRLSMPEGGHAGKTAQWRIPVKQGERAVSAITGQLAWRPIVAQSSE